MLRVWQLLQVGAGVLEAQPQSQSWRDFLANSRVKKHGFLADEPQVSQLAAVLLQPPQHAPLEAIGAASAPASHTVVSIRYAAFTVDPPRDGESQREADRPGEHSDSPPGMSRPDFRSVTPGPRSARFLHALGRSTKYCRLRESPTLSRFRGVGDFRAESWFIG